MPATAYPDRRVVLTGRVTLPTVPAAPGLPDFQRIGPVEYRDAVTGAMLSQRRALDALARASQGQLEVDRVIGAWEQAGLGLQRALDALFTQKDAESTPELDALHAQLAPQLAAHADAIHMDPRLYALLTRIEQGSTDGTIKLDQEQAWWLHRQLADFRRAGADLDTAQQSQLTSINRELATLSARYDELVIAGRNAAAVQLTDPADLTGLTEAQIAQAAQAASDRGLDGWLLELVNTTQQEWLTRLERREVRRRVFDASVNRGTAGPADTREVIERIARLRAERAHLLGYLSHAEYVAADACAGSESNVHALLDRLTQVSRGLLDQDTASYRQAFAELAPGEEFAAWDWQYVATRQRAQVAVDDETVRPYLEFDRVLHDGVLAAAKALYGIGVRPRPDLRGYTADCRVYEVVEEDGAPLGLLIVDPYARPTKQGGAWMTQLAAGETLTGQLPIVTLNTNVPRPVGDQPALLSWDQVITMFHEFGHCLHGLFARPRYPSRSGANGPIDYIEFPSQVNEHWAWQPQFIAGFARHYRTGEPIPAELVDRLRAAAGFDTGYSSFQTVAAQQLDQAWHTTPADHLPANPAQVASFEAAALAARGVADELVPPRYHSTYFSHIWGNGYAAAYYAYLWAEVMDADTCAWFDANGGASRANGDRFRHQVLAYGDAVDVMAAYRQFRGADPDVAYLVARREHGTR